MLEVKQLSGFMNLDDANNIIPSVHHKRAFNVRFRGNGNNYRAESCWGNRLIPNKYLPSGRNECIGSFYDQNKQRLFWFNWNSNDRHGIYQYNLKSKEVTPLLVCFENSLTDILGFDLSFPIASVVILYTTEEDGDIIHWVARNNRPMKLNIKDAINNIYGTQWLFAYLTVNRTTPPGCPTCSYADDATVDINNLRSKLYQFRYRFVYKDFTKSTWSAYSSLFSPPNPDDLSVNVDPHKNNKITVLVYTGDPDVIRVEISARQSITSTFSDPFLVADLDKSDLSIDSNSFYTFEFFNDKSYPPVDLEENDLLWSVVPQRANAMELLNGNVITYGATQEGYNLSEALDVSATVELVDNTNPLLNYVTGVFFWKKPGPRGDTINVKGEIAKFSGDITSVSTVSLKMSKVYSGVTYSYISTYTYSGGDDIQDMITYFHTDINANGHTDPDIHKGFYASDITDNNSLNTIPADAIAVTNSKSLGPNDPQNNGTINLSITIVSGGGSSSSIDIAMFHHLSRYDFGVVYFDEFDETNGVITNTTLSIETPEVDTTGETQMKIPQITFEINSQPPIWAKKFSLVVTNSLTYLSTLTTVSCNTKKDTKYGYLNITNQQGNQSNYPPYDFTNGDRVRLFGRYGEAIDFIDVPVVGLFTDPKINGSTETGDWVKVPFDTTTMTNWGTAGYENIDMELYTPAKNTEPDLRVYYEFGESYNVINPGTITRAHQGKTQDQIPGIGGQPAIYPLLRGDFYIRTRQIPFAADLSNVTVVWITDQSVSDLYPSKVKNNGRAYVIDKAAVNTFFMTRLRWGLAYQQNTNINQTNIFYPLNLDESDRRFGAIQRLMYEERLLYVYSNRKVGQYGVYSKFITTNSGGQQLITTNEIITTNNINYLDGDYGLGDQYTGLTRGRNVHYFSDPVRGVEVRRSGKGLDPVSIQNKAQYFFPPVLTPFNNTYTRPTGGNAKILKVYDYFEDEVITCTQAGTNSGNEILPLTISFNERRNAYSSFFEFYPEWITSAEDKLYSWHEGNLFIHDKDATPCNFYFEQKYPSIKLVYNDKVLVTKTPMAIGYEANQIWTCPNDGDILTSFISPDTKLPQISKLKEFNFSDIEGKTVSALLRDINSRQDKNAAWHNGAYLKGFWVEISFTYKGTDTAFLYLPFLKYSLSNPNS